LYRFSVIFFTKSLNNFDRLGKAIISLVYSCAHYVESGNNMNLLSKIHLLALGCILVLSACNNSGKITYPALKPVTSSHTDILIPASTSTGTQLPSQQVDTSNPAGTSTGTQSPHQQADTSIPASTSTATPSPDQHVDPLALISQESIISYVEALTSIQPYSGWRNSATEGEAEALDYVASTLSGFGYLQHFGLELERQTFGVFSATELWETRLYITTSEGECEVPADGLRGHRHDIKQALRFDSDGMLNDSERDPLEVAGQVTLVRETSEIENLEETSFQNKVVFLDFALLDRWTNPEGQDERIATMLFEQDIAGLVLVTQFSDNPEESHGSYLGDGISLEKVSSDAAPPVLYVRLEDLAAAGIDNWQGLARVEAARLVWDSDVYSPGTSGNLVARIPGVDSSRAVILGAHIDSPNSPGAMDNGVNSAVLLELARVLDQAHLRPPVDLYLVWFGSEELWLYGSQYFVNSHQELLDRTIAALLMDSIIVSTSANLLVLDGMSHSRFWDGQLAFPRYLAEKTALQNISIDEVQDYQGVASDNGVFSAFVPQAGVAFGSPQGGYAHSPYDTVERIRDLGDLMEEVASIALIAALETGEDLPDLRPFPEPDRRALIVASHTEVAHMTPATLIDFVRALAWEGFDVDVIPYGQVLTAADLTDAGLVVVLPIIDYASLDGDPGLYDEAWGPREIESLVAYVDSGGLLVLANSANRIQFGKIFDANEDWEDANALSAPFGITFEPGVLSASRAQVRGEHPLMGDRYTLTLLKDNAVPFSLQTGEILAEVGGSPVVGLVDFGEAGGQVLVLADVGMLGYAGFMPPEGDNLGFFQSLARYARTR
jgi:hypothetical protein